MTVVATVDVPAEAIHLDEAMDATPNASIRLDRIVPLGDAFVPYLWVADESVERVEDALQDASEVTSVEVVDRFEDEALVRVEWRRPDDVFALVGESGGVVLEAVGEDGSWRLHLRFPSRDELGAFYRACGERDIPVDLVNVHGLDPPGSAPGDLTEAQTEALTVALAMGYFEVPRRATLSDVATELGISDSAVSQRIRRGVGTVLTQAMGGDPTPPE